MNENTKKLIQTVSGLALLITVQKKTYAFKHGEVKTKRDFTLGGLYANESTNSQADTQAEPTTQSVSYESVWGDNPTAEQRGNLGDTLLALPQILSGSGVKVMDDQLNDFHNHVKAIKAQLLKLQQNGTISEATMKKAEKYMEPYNLNGYTLKVTAVRVSKDPIKLGKLRADGLYEARQTLRTIYIDRMLSKSEIESILQYIVDSIMNPIVKEMTTVGMYKVSSQNDGTIVFTPDARTKYSVNGETFEKSYRFGTPPGVRPRQDDNSSGYKMDRIGK